MSTLPHGPMHHAWLGVQRALTAGGWPARVAYALGAQRRIEWARHRVAREAPGADFPALRVAFASDFHAGPSTHPRLLEHARDALAASRPDLLLLGGDFVCLDAADIQPLARLLGSIPAPLGRFAVLGNHDYWSGGERVVAALEDAGIRVLVNRSVRLPAPFDGLGVVGLDDPIAGLPDLSYALRGAPERRLVLMHAPDGMTLLGDTPFDVAFAGHTHGGQVALPGGIPILVPPGRLNRQYAWGRYDVGGERELIVSRGVGCSTLPIRLGCPPELVQVDYLPAGRLTPVPPIEHALPAGAAR